MFFIKIYIKESYMNYYHKSIQMCGQYCILAPSCHFSQVRDFLPSCVVGMCFCQAFFVRIALQLLANFIWQLFIYQPITNLYFLQFY